MSLDNFSESEHPRGQPDNPGQFAPAGGGGSSSEKIKGTGRGAEKQPDFQGSLARQTSGDTEQPVKSVDELYERALKEEPKFKKQMEDIAKAVGGEVQYTPAEYAEPGTVLKSRKSAERKLKSELNDNPGELRDVLRATIASDDNEKTRKAAAEFIGEHSDNILRVKDRIMDPLKGGYRDILINYRTPDGLVAEVQFNSKNMIKAKNEQAHALYEKARELVNPSREVLEEIENAMAAIYEKAYLADGDGGWQRKKEAMPAHDSADPTNPVVRRYKLSPASGVEFEAALVDEGGKLVVVSNRNGKWGPEEKLTFADLIMPEQHLSDWDVVSVEPKPLEDDKFDSGGVITTRATDRRNVDTGDIEYFTEEVLGPNRERTPEGFLICYDVPAARVGEMTYGPREVPPELGVGRDGTIRVTRSAAEVFDPRSMASLNGKPVTDDHPPVDVDPQNWAFYTKGVVVNPRRGDGDRRDFLVVDMIVYDGTLIDEIEEGKRQVSCGYNPEYLQILDPETREPIPGRGEQVKLRYNHLALVSAGRCGPVCAVRDHRTVDQIAQTESFWTPKRAKRLDRMLRRIK